ncbi:MAG: NAD(P)-dependent oxidoreductase [Bacteroidota bacterium]
MEKQKILFLDTTHEALVESLNAMGFVCEHHAEMPLEEVMQIIGDYTGVIIRSRLKIDEEFINAGKNLRFIARAGSGMEGIDVQYAEKKGIACINSPEGNRDAVGEQATGLLLALMNNLMKADREVRRGIWIREGNRGHEIKGKTIGIIGYGNMGSAFAKRISGFDARVISYDKYKTNYSDGNTIEVTLEKIFDEADILSLHVPLTEETHYMVNDDFLKLFRKNIYLLNTSRGKVVDSHDLVKHLKSGHVLGAALDVLEYEAGSFEKLDMDNLPSAFSYIIQSERVVLSPHIAGWTHESHIRHAQVLAEKIISLFQSEL